MSNQDIALLKSQYATIVLDGGSVGQITLPDGTVLNLTAAQTVHARVEPHGNAGRSRIQFTIVVEVQAQGSADTYRELFKQALLLEIEAQREEVSKWRNVAEQRRREKLEPPSNGNSD